MKKITIFGGSGFIGPYVVRELAKANYQITVVSRSMIKEKELKLSGNLGQISVRRGDIRNPDDIRTSIMGSEIVINLVAILGGNSSSSMDEINNLACGALAKISAECGVKRFIHFSALVGCAGTTRYGKSKIEGENAVRAAFPDSIIIRPSVVFGEEDNFINSFIKLGKRLRIIPLPLGGKAVFQPVYVADLSRFVCRVVQDDNLRNKVYTVTGPKEYTLGQICSIIRENLKMKMLCLHVPYWLIFCMARIIGFSLFKPMNKLLYGRTAPIVTCEQVRMLKYSSVSNKNALPEFGISPTLLEEKLPLYVENI
ncbi:saccharopine dehydrogenase family protein [Neorickettsia helminthoeca str. Oregon]|uniref:Saccharopine dehydrogenase family protein n=1 Tax=Neorickettsia helminthoeca str. Oregon TaxID=1286528 RepID=X5HJP9_9RICK|nr:complex I NDUFA9 subunit family protein [Neorickettsia helminthoeca]AHX11319.1 saccharopine dehydrogenase family protein [Neorickettsia helminthoeca str. Oregon]